MRILADRHAVIAPVLTVRLAERVPVLGVPHPLEHWHILGKGNNEKA